jgi:hypothetical protein
MIPEGNAGKRRRAGMAMLPPQVGDRSLFVTTCCEVVHCGNHAFVLA